MPSWNALTQKTRHLNVSVAKTSLIPGPLPPPVLETPLCTWNSLVPRPSPAPFSWPHTWQFKGHICGQENGVGDGLGTRLHMKYTQQYAHMHSNIFIHAYFWCFRIVQIFPYSTLGNLQVIWMSTRGRILNVCSNQVCIIVHLICVEAG